MQQVRLGRSGLVVSRLAFGTWQLGGDWGPTDTAEAMGAIRRAVDEGVTFFDSPPDGAHRLGGVRWPPVSTELPGAEGQA